MTKHCIICNDPAIFQIKDAPDYYCQSCAEENFSDISMLVKVEEQAQKLKEYIKEKTNAAAGENNVSDDADRED